jgi:hypothetical protein
MLRQSKVWDGLPIRYLLLISFSVRLFIFLLVLLVTDDYSVFHSPDTGGYVKLAMELMSTGYFTNDGYPEIVRTPGYPIFLIPGLFLGNVEIITILLQVVLGCLSTYLIFKIAHILFNNTRTSWFCGFLYAIEPISILYTNKILTETIFTSTILLFLYFILHYFVNKSLFYLISASVALSVATYVRPISYLLPLIVTVFLFIFICLNRRNVQLLLIHSFIFLLSSMIITGLWQLRNKIETGYSGFSGISDVSFFFYQAASVLAKQQNIPYYTMQDRLGYSSRDIYLLNHYEQRTWPYSQQLRYMRNEGIKILFNNPLIYLKIHIKGMLLILFDPGATDYLKLFNLYPESGGLLGFIIDEGIVKSITTLAQEKPLVFWSNVFLGLNLMVYLGLSIIALAAKNFVSNFQIVFLLNIGLYYFIISGGPQGLNRFRHPLMPLICILSGYSLALIVERFTAIFSQFSRGRGRWHSF